MGMKEKCSFILRSTMPNRKRFFFFAFCVICLPNLDYSLRIIDEWIPMNSSRLRQAQNKGATSGKITPKRPIPTFTLGEQCRAKWTDSRKWKATVTEVLDNGKNTYNLFY